ncbi:alpha/beta hydrolase family protein [Paenibacillus hodogayensis]|uniref:Alpha/beta hydrolase family protein n=1 Tax=Paenibacillus hodogayensis TaxID=279208 RepID=A0ABV5VR49_9BACL
MHMKTYLNQAAKAASDRALPVFRTAADFERWRKDRQRRFHEMLGIDVYLAEERTPMHVRITGSVDCGTHRIDKLHYQSLPGLYVAANLYIPAALTAPAPGVLYLCGHHQTQKVNYQEHARRFAQEGFVTLVLDTIQLGEVQGVHHGTYSRGNFDWVSRGYTPAAAEVWNAIRGLDLLGELDEVDERRLGVTGHSGGGSISWWTACADDRVKAMASSSGTGDLASHIRERTLDYHCDCNFPNNADGWSSAESYALAAPRPVLIVAPDRDRVFRIDAVRQVYEKLKELYVNLGAGDKIDLLAFREQHMYTPASRKRIFSWFLTHLAGRPTTTDEAADFDGVKLPEEQLLVFKGQPPADDRSTTVQNWLIRLPEPTDIRSADQLAAEKTRLLVGVRKECFGAFPEQPLPLAVELEQEYWNGDSFSRKFSFASEGEWRLNGELRGRANDSIRPAAVCLRQSSHRKEEEPFRSLAGLKGEWIKARIDVRGTGDTAWGTELNWHIRRAAALIGQTVAAMRVWDALRGLEAVRLMPEVDRDRILLAGAGEMAVVALLAVLLDGSVSTLVLEDMPSSFTRADDPERLGEGYEVVNMLRHADLPQLAAMLWPTTIIVTGKRWEGYEWTERAYARLGEPGRIQFRTDLNVWSAGAE